MVKPKTGVHSGMVRTVLGPIPVEAMGVTLMHEHIVLDTSSWWKRPCCASDIGFAERPLDISMIGDLRMNPFLNRDNCGLLDVKVAIEELAHFVEYGGRTVVDPTNVGIGRDPSALQRISRRTGLNIVMGAGFYLEPSHPGYVRDMSVDVDRRGDRDRLRRLRRTIRKSAPGSSARSASARTSRPRRKRCCAAPRAPPKLAARH